LEKHVMKRILTTALVMVLASVAQAAAINQIRLTPGEITAKEAVDTGAGTSGVAGIHTTVLLGDPTKPGLTARDRPRATKQQEKVDGRKKRG
jgi:opacity protein-like surface antigen